MYHEVIIEGTWTSDTTKKYWERKEKRKLSLQEVEVIFEKKDFDRFKNSEERRESC